MAKNKKKVVKKTAPKKAAKPAAKKPAAASKPMASANKSGVTPLADRILISPTVPESVTSFGLIIPETVDKEKPETGVVVAVGPGKMNDMGAIVPPGVSVGDRVVFEKYHQTEVKVNDTTYYIVSEANILAILTK